MYHTTTETAGAAGATIVRTQWYGLAASLGCVAALLLMAVSSRPPAVLMLCSFVALTIVNYLVGGRDVLYPAFIFSAVWSAATAVYLLCPVEIDDLSWKAVLIFIGGALCFTGGCMTGCRPFLAGTTLFADRSRSELGVRILLLCSVVALPIAVVNMVRVVGQSVISPDFFIASRETLQNADAPTFSSRFLSLTQLIAVPTVWLLLLERERKLLILAGAVLAIFVSLLGGTRGPLLQMVCGCLVIALVRRSNRTITGVGKTIAVSSIAVVLLMTVLTLVLKKETRGSDGVQIALSMSAVYIAGPLAAFNYQVGHPGLFSDQPWNTVTPLLSPLVKSGVMRVAIPPVHEDFINIPFPFNVFTIYKPYYHDLGIAGCMLVLAIVGFIYGYVYRAAVRGNKMALFFLAAFTESLVMSIFHDPFNYRLTVCVFTVGFALFYFLLLRKLPRVTLGRVAIARS
jgi:oligosaccharide repeat unit polymerase